MTSTPAPAKSQEHERSKRYVGQWYDNSLWITSPMKEIPVEEFLRRLGVPPLPEGSRAKGGSYLYNTFYYLSPWRILHGEDFETDNPFQYITVERVQREDNGYDYTIFFHRATGEVLFEWNVAEYPWTIVERRENCFELRYPKGPFSGLGKVMLAIYKRGD